MKSKTYDQLKEKFKDSPHNVYELPVEIEIEKLCDVEERKVEWLWKDIIAFGKITLIAGEPGVGKSQLLLYIASVLSKGDKFHFEDNKCDAANVLLISGEDNSEDTLKPRLMALNAILGRIDNVKGIKKTDKNGNLYFDAICLINNLADLEEKIIKNKYKLIIVDPISVYLGSIDDIKHKEIRSALNILSALAERHNIALVLINHFNKPSGSASVNAIYRIMGSIGFTAAARIVFGVMKDPDDSSKRLFIPIKNNIGQDKIGYCYKIKPMVVGNGIDTSKIEWLDEKIDKSANEILNHSPEIKSPRREECKLFLQDILRNGCVPLSTIFKEGQIMGYSKDTIYAARNELNINEQPSIDRKNGKVWMLA